MSSFFPNAINAWNNVITHFENIPSINILKDHILSLIRLKKKDIFGIHDPLGLRYLLQLRVGLSLLRYHKKCHNFIDTPSAICLCNNGIEDINHFLFLCPFFCHSQSNLGEKCNTNHTKIQPESFRKPITSVSIWSPNHKPG